MPTSGEPSALSLSVVSNTIPRPDIERLLAQEGIYAPSGHFEYPVSEDGKKGNHLDALFIIEPICANPELVDIIARDMHGWLKSERIAADVILAPAQGAVRVLADKLCELSGLGKAYWEYKPSGWFGDHLVEGEIKAGQKVLVFNGVTQQGLCVGKRLPEFAEALGATVVAAAVFAKGTASGVNEAECRFGKKFYAAVEVDIKIASPGDCPQCRGGKALVPWTDFRDGKWKK